MTRKSTTKTTTTAKRKAAPRGPRARAQLDLTMSDNRTTALARRSPTTMASKRKTATRTAPTTIVVRESMSLNTRPASPPARQPIYTAVAARRLEGARKSPAARKQPRHVGATVRKGVAIAGAVIGYMDRPGSALEATLAKVPALGGSRKITLALGLHLAARKRPGGFIDHAATAMTAIASYDVGRNGFGNLGLQGDGDDRAPTRARF